MKKEALQKLILFLFFAVIVLGLVNITSIRQFNYLTNYAVWFLWWPFLMVLGLLSIRFWCMVCPLRYVAEIYGKYSFGLNIPKIMEKYKTLTMVFLFMILHSVVITFNIGRLPITTAIYLLILLQYSAVMALIFKKNSFCSVFCPLGGVMNIFARIGFVRFGSGNKNKCLNCTNKNCGQNCPAGLAPKELPDEACVFCLHCVESCGNHNLHFSIQNPFQFAAERGSQGEFLSIIILLGIALGEFRERLEEMAVPGGNWNLLPGKIIEFIPNKISLLHPNPYVFKVFLTAWDYVLIPLLLVGIAAIILRVIFFRRSLNYHLRNLSFSIVPLVYSIFLAVLINYPLSLLYSGPAFVRKILLLVVLLLGLLASLYILVRNLYTDSAETLVNQ